MRFVLSQATKHPVLDWHCRCSLVCPPMLTADPSRVLLADRAGPPERRASIVRMSLVGIMRDTHDRTMMAEEQ
jgi:hypothetical protein